MDIISGLTSTNLRPYTDSLLQIILISDFTWNPTSFENTISEDDKWFDSISDYVEEISSLFDMYVDYDIRYGDHNVSFYRYDIGDRNIPLTDIQYIINTSDYTQSGLIQPSTLRTDITPDYVSHIPHTI